MFERRSSKESSEVGVSESSGVALVVKERVEGGGAWGLVGVIESGSGVEKREFEVAIGFILWLVSQVDKSVSYLFDSFYYYRSCNLQTMF